MKRHLKRQIAPRSWPIARKGTKFVIKNNSKGIPLLVVLRDLMQVVQNRSEAKTAIHKRDIVISGKTVNDEKKSLELFDVVTFLPSKKNYQIILSQKGKYDFKEIPEKEAKTKLAKVVGKKPLKGKKMQINLSDGRNYVSDLSCKVGDSAMIGFEKKQIEKILPVKEKAKVLVVGGKHAGEHGKIQKIIEGKMAEIETSEKKFRALVKQIMVLE